MSSVNSKKYEKLIATGRSLFWKYGIKRVTIDEICRESSVSKMTFYKYFKNREDFACTILNEIVEDGLKVYSEIMSGDMSFQKKVEKIIEFKIKMSENMSYEVMHDIYSGAFPKLREMMIKRSNENIAILMNDFRKAQEAGEITRDFDLKFVLYFLNKSIEIVNDKELNKIYNTPQELIGAFVKFFFYGIVAREK